MKVKKRMLGIVGAAWMALGGVTPEGLGTRPLAQAQELSRPEAAPAVQQTAPRTEPARRAWSLGVEGGIASGALMGQASLHLPWGVVIGAEAGRHLGPAVGGYLAYDIPLTTHVSLRPGLRASRMWAKTQDCATTCRFDQATFEVGLHVQSIRGLTLDVGVPLLGLVPVAPSDGEGQPHAELYTLATPELAFYTTLMVGWTFDL